MSAPPTREAGCFRLLAPVPIVAALVAFLLTRKACR